MFIYKGVQEDMSKPFTLEIGWCVPDDAKDVGELKVRKVAAVSDAKSAVSDGATRTARWRGKQDPEVLKQRNRDAVQRCRAKKAGKGKV